MPNYSWYTWNIENWGTKWDFGKETYDRPAPLFLNPYPPTTYDTKYFFKKPS